MCLGILLWEENVFQLTPKSKCHLKREGKTVGTLIYIVVTGQTTSIMAERQAGEGAGSQFSGAW